jgi:hypothetical protein
MGVGGDRTPVTCNNLYEPGGHYWEKPGRQRETILHEFTYIRNFKVKLGLWLSGIVPACMRSWVQSPAKKRRKRKSKS